MATPSPSICVYPLSPTYLLLHRCLYYLCLVLSVLYPTPPPLVKGAFAFSLTYSSTAALYAILILAIPSATAGAAAASSSTSSSSSLPMLNLDVLALWAVLSPAAILLLPLVSWSRSLSRSARPIVRTWGVLILVGVACTFVLLRRTQQESSSGPAAAGSAATLADCQAAAADGAVVQRLRLRDPAHILSVSRDAVFNPLFGAFATRLAPLTFVPLAFGALSCLVSASDQSAQSTAAAAAVSAGGKSVDPFSSPQSGWGGGGLEEVSWADSMSTSPFVAVYKVFLLLRRMVLYLTPGWLLPVLVVNELYLLRNWPLGVPEAESMYEVGQWGLFAGLGLVSAAALINRVAAGGRDDSSGDACVA